jgi:hypothetical protein
LGNTLALKKLPLMKIYKFLAVLIQVQNSHISEIRATAFLANNLNEICNIYMEEYQNAVDT